MASSSQSRGEFETAVAEAVIAQVRTVLPKGMGDTLSLDTPLVELGLDSLKIMEVINHTETLFGVRFREEWLYDLETCRDVAVCVAANLPQGVALPQPAPGLEAARPEGRAGGSIPSQHYDVTQFPECVALDRRLAEAAEAGLVNPFFRCNEAVCRPLARIDGREVVNYTSFDYLGLASHTAVIAAAKEALDQFGTSASASRLVGGDNTLLRQLDEEIARFLGTEAAIVFPSGYGTNASLFGHLFGSEDLILHDALAHNSIVQGSLLSRAHRTAFPHNDADALDALLRDIRGEYRRVVVAVEGVYSMDGDYPDLPRFLEIKRRHKALLYVNEAHSLGVLGARGRGICEHFGVDPSEGDLWMGTISKALASGGGYLAGRQSLVRYLKYTTPAFVFATACSPPNAAASLAALRLIRQEPDRVTRLRDRAALFARLRTSTG